MVLNKRIIREFRKGFVKYGAMVFLIILSVSLVISMAGAADTVIDTVEYTSEQSNAEDGEFQVLSPFNETQVSELSKLGVSMEEKLNIDLKSDKGGELRVFANREKLNLVTLEEGSFPINDKDVVIEKNYSKKHNLKCEDKIILDHTAFTIVGIGSAPDYGNIVKNISDVLSDTSKFSICFVTKNSLVNLAKQEKAITYEYAYELNNGCTHEKLKDYLTKTKMDLTFFVESEDNQRMTSCVDDELINKYIALTAGLIITILIAYMLSVFSVHNIENESAIIGTMYSMGYVKSELIRHFMILPTVLTVSGSIIGTVLGFIMIPTHMSTSLTYYSLPENIHFYPPYLIVFGIIIPIVITVFVNYIILNKKLKEDPLRLLRKENKQHRITNIDLKNMGFINRYRLRQLLRELRGNITMFFGLFVAILLMMLGFCIYGCLDKYINGIVEDVKYEYQYILSAPIEKITDGSETAFTKGLNTKYYMTGKDMEVSLQGINNNSKYFDFHTDSDKNEVFISDSAAYKFKWKKGDTIYLEDETSNCSYTFKVKDIVNFASGLYVFMDINNMRQFFGENNDYFNTLLSSEKLDIPIESTISVITRDEMRQAANQMYDMMTEMLITVIFVSTALLVIVMYLLLKMMIDRSSFSISLIKVFGYTGKEIKKLYLGSNFYTVLFTVIVAFPISRQIIFAIYPYFVSNVAAGMPTAMPITLILAMAAIIMVSYFIVNVMLSKHLEKISLVEILKSRE